MLERPANERADRTDAERPEVYDAPGIVEIGSVEDITHGTSGVGPDVELVVSP